MALRVGVEIRLGVDIMRVEMRLGVDTLRLGVDTLRLE